MLLSVRCLIDSIAARFSLLCMKLGQKSRVLDSHVIDRCPDLTVHRLAIARSQRINYPQPNCRIRSMHQVHGVLLVAFFLLIASRASNAQTQTPEEAARQSSPVPIRRDSQAIAVLSQCLAAFHGAPQPIQISSLRVTGTLVRSQSSSAAAVPFTYDSLFKTNGVEFRRHTGSYSPNRAMVSNGGKISSTNSGPHVPPFYYRYIFQPDYVPYVLLSQAMADESVEVKSDDGSVQVGSEENVFHISTSSGSDHLGRTLYVRHWTISKATFLPISSYVCLKSYSVSACHLPIEDTYSNYQAISGIFSPALVTSQIGNLEKVTYTINSIDTKPDFALGHFTIDGANADAK
jgi:hypothetical protein